MNKSEMYTLRVAIAQLRHAYTHLVTNGVSKEVQKDFANGLISPQIATLEKIIAEYENKEAASKYNVGDFVAFYEGMGEQGHGLIKQINERDQYYVIIPYFEGIPRGYVHTVTLNDMRGKCTIEDELQYEKERGS